MPRVSLSRSLRSAIDSSPVKPGRLMLVCRRDCCNAYEGETWQGACNLETNVAEF